MPVRGWGLSSSYRKTGPRSAAAGTSTTGGTAAPIGFPAKGRITWQITPAAPAPRTRMSAAKRRQQLVEVGRRIRRNCGYDGNGRGDRCRRRRLKPVVYEHFGGKEGLYAVVCDRELAFGAGSRVPAGRGSRRPSNGRRWPLATWSALTGSASVRDSPAGGVLFDHSTTPPASPSSSEEEFAAHGFDPVTTIVYASRWSAGPGPPSGGSTWTPPRRRWPRHRNSLPQTVAPGSAPTRARMEITPATVTQRVSDP